MFVKPITISTKGQIALPKDIIKHLNSKALKLEILNDNEVKIVPLRDVAGRLSTYAKNLDISDFNNIKNNAWEEAIEEKFFKANKHD